MSYGAPPPPAPGGGYGMAAPQAHPQAVLILVLGILSIPCCGFFTGIPAIIMGGKAKDGDYSNVGLIKAGWICGIIGTILSVIGLILNIVIRVGS